jgi:prepilin-type processing-associated H-X9-DG protein
VSSEVVRLFLCPSETRTNAPPPIGVGLLSYLGVSGNDLNQPTGVLFLNSAVKLGAIKDGASNTIAMGERPPSPRMTMGWWYAGWGQNKTGSGDMILGVRELNVHFPQCPPGPYAFTRGNLGDSCAAFYFWSLHPGGSNFVFADGAVRFLAYSADAILPALATRAGGEAVSDID